MGSLLRMRPALRPEVEPWARIHGRVPPYSRECNRTIGLAWRLLVELRVLRDGMPLASAIEVLGPPSSVLPETNEQAWFVPGGCHVSQRVVMETRGDIVRHMKFN